MKKQNNLAKYLLEGQNLIIPSGLKFVSGTKTAEFSRELDTRMQTTRDKIKHTVQ